ncbi:MAG: glycosyltransferase [Boseongicola sp.]|nr:MAG: glycosyltransferase [Boseongicola sp.]
MSQPINTPTFSVVVASHGRPAWLKRCLTALWQLDYPAFEIVVAADRAGLTALSGHPAMAWGKSVQCDKPNISETRNAGLALAAGKFVAFIDDDAAPEPKWLRHHADALAASGAVASVGYVRGRNGISFQSRAASIDAEAETHTEPHFGTAPFVPKLQPGRAAKLVGTNAVISADILRKLGGFDPVYRYFMDDTDLSLRLAKAGHTTVIAPLAEVHHAFAASNLRTAQRRPRSLFDVGRSTSIYLRRHLSGGADEIRERVEKRELRRLHAHMVRGTC